MDGILLYSNPKTEVDRVRPNSEVRWGPDAVFTLHSHEEVAENQKKLKNFYYKLDILKNKHEKGEDVTDAVLAVRHAARRLGINHEDPHLVREIAKASGTGDDTGVTGDDTEYVGGKRSRRKSHRRKSHKRKTPRRKHSRREHSRHKHSRHKHSRRKSHKRKSKTRRR